MASKRSFLRDLFNHLWDNYLSEIKHKEYKEYLFQHYNIIVESLYLREKYERFKSSTRYKERNPLSKVGIYEQLWDIKTKEDKELFRIQAEYSFTFILALEDELKAYGKLKTKTRTIDTSDLIDYERVYEIHDRQKITWEKACYSVNERDKKFYERFAKFKQRKKIKTLKEFQEYRNNSNI